MSTITKIYDYAMLAYIDGHIDADIFASLVDNIDDIIVRDQLVIAKSLHCVAIPSLKLCVSGDYLFGNIINSISYPKVTICNMSMFGEFIYVPEVYHDALLEYGSDIFKSYRHYPSVLQCNFPYFSEIQIREIILNLVKKQALIIDSRKTTLFTDYYMVHI